MQYAKINLSFFERLLPLLSFVMFPNSSFHQHQTFDCDIPMYITIKT